MDDQMMMDAWEERSTMLHGKAVAVALDTNVRAQAVSTKEATPASSVHRSHFGSRGSSSGPSSAQKHT